MRSGRPVGSGGAGGVRGAAERAACGERRGGRDAAERAACGEWRSGRDAAEMYPWARPVVRAERNHPPSRAAKAGTGLTLVPLVGILF